MILRQLGSNQTEISFNNGTSIFFPMKHQSQVMTLLKVISKLALITVALQVNTLTTI